MAIRKKFKDINSNVYFEIVGLEGYYKVNHEKREVKAYRGLNGSKRIYDGVVRGLYDSLESGGWKIK